MQAHDTDLELLHSGRIGTYSFIPTYNTHYSISVAASLRPNTPNGRQPLSSVPPPLDHSPTASPRIDIKVPIPLSDHITHSPALDTSHRMRPRSCHELLTPEQSGTCFVCASLLPNTTRTAAPTGPANRASTAALSVQHQTSTCTCIHVHRSPTC